MSPTSVDSLYLHNLSNYKKPLSTNTILGVKAYLKIHITLHYKLKQNERIPFLLQQIPATFVTIAFNYSETLKFCCFA